MEGEVCEGCGERSVAMDREGLVMVCEACGLVRQEADLRRAEYSREGESLGTFVGGVGTVASIGGGARPWSSLSSSSSSSETSRIESRRNHTLMRLDAIAALLRLPKDRIDDVKQMLDVVTEGRWGSGRWIELLIGTCIYACARENRLPVLAAEISDSVSCSVRELFKMYRQVCHLLQLRSPAVDQSVLFDHAVFHARAFSSVGRDALRRICKQGHLLLELAADWFLSSGRHPSSLAAAAIIIIGKANNIEAELEEISHELRIHPHTTKARVKELIDYLVAFGQRLPWGKDIGPKSVLRHLPFLLQYSQQTVRKPQLAKLSPSDARCVVPTTKKPKLPSSHGAQAPLAKAACAEYGKRTDRFLRTQSQSFDLKEDECVLEGSSDAPQTAEHDRGASAATIEPPATDSVSCCEGAIDFLPSRKRRRKSGDAADREGTEKHREVVRETVSAVPGIDKKWQPLLPPSFVAGRAAKEFRAAKIKAIKERIASVKRSIVAEIRAGFQISADDEPLPPMPRSPSSPRQPDGKFAKALDAEDMLIQYCLLRGGDEKLLEAGYYSLVLSTPPVQPCGDPTSDDDLLQYFNTPKKVEFLRSISEGEPPYPWLTNDELQEQA